LRRLRTAVLLGDSRPRLSELVFIRFNHVARFIVNANQSIM
jgi:hypothetical protein